MIAVKLRIDLYTFLYHDEDHHIASQVRTVVMKKEGEGIGRKNLM